MTVALKPERFDLLHFRSQPIMIRGKSLIADRSGGLFWPSQRMLVVSDLKLGSELAGNAKGRATWGRTRETLLRLVEVIDHYEPQTVVSLGDSLYDASAPGIQADDLDILKIMQEDRRWVWVGGGRNRLIPTSFGGQELRELMLEGITLRRSPWPTHATHEIAGGMLPVARVSIHGTALRRLCFVGNGLRLVLPAFGASRGGLNILDDAFNRILGSKGLAVWMLGDEGLYPIAGRLLRED